MWIYTWCSVYFSTRMTKTLFYLTFYLKIVFFFCLFQSRLLSPSNTHSSLSTSTGSGRHHSLWRPSRACGLSAATTVVKACPPTPMATLSCSGNSMLVCATGFCCPSVSCWLVPFWSAPSSYWTPGQLASLWVLGNKQTGHRHVLEPHITDNSQ